MSVTTDAAGRRSRQIEFVVDGTPDEVWQAIATGPGISSWLMPAEFEERDGKPVALKLSFSPELFFSLKGRAAKVALTVDADDATAVGPR